MAATLTDQELLDEIALKIKSNGGGAITGPILKAVLELLVNNKAGLITHLTKLGLRKLDPTRDYGSGEGFIYNGAIWESKNGHLAGMNPDDPQGSVFNRLTAVPTIQNFDEWVNNNNPGYGIGETVRRDFRLFESLVANNLGNDPLLETYPGSTIWKEVSASENKWGEDWVTNRWYTKRQVVYKDGGFYWLNIISETFLSTDFATELADGKWVSIGSAGGSGAAAEILAADIAERDGFAAQMDAGDYIFVTDASDDPTVDSGWAKYRLNSDDSWTKTAEQESLDLLYQKAGRTEGDITVTDLTYTILEGDIGKEIGMANVNPQKVIIPLNHSAPISAYWDFQQELQGQLEFEPAAGVTILGISNAEGKWKIELRYGGARLIKKAANVYRLKGNMEV